MDLVIHFADLETKMPDDFGPIERLQQDGKFSRAIPLPRLLGRDAIARVEGLLQRVEAKGMKLQILPVPSVRGEKSPTMKFAGFAFDDANNAKTAITREG
jgi:hypothetical protein